MMISPRAGLGLVVTALIIMSNNFVHGFSTLRMQQKRHLMQLQMSRSSVDFCNEVDYSSCIDEMVELLESTQENLARLKELAEHVKELEVEDHTLGEVMGTSEDAMALRTKVADAKAAVDARYAGAFYEEAHDYTTIVDTRLLDDTMNSIGRLDALQQFLKVEQQRLIDEPDSAHP